MNHYETVTVSKEMALSLNICKYANVKINDINELIDVILDNKTNKQVSLSLIINEVNNYSHYGRDEFYKKLYSKRKEIPKDVKMIVSDNVELLNSLRSVATLSVIFEMELHPNFSKFFSTEIVYLTDFETVQTLFNIDNFKIYLSYFQDYDKVDLFKTQDLFDYLFEIKKEYYRENEFAMGLIEKYLINPNFRNFVFLKEENFINIFKFTWDKTNVRVKRFVEIVKKENPNFNDFILITTPQPKELI